MVELEVMVETQLVIILTVIDIDELEVRVEIHSMVIDEEVEILDVHLEQDEMVETQYVDVDEMVEMLIDFIIIDDINEVTDDTDI